ncbi:sugar-binding protein [Solicola gregarius]|uniref:PIG-L family deacetylase n=1 Tax=Solicola gregarius TaxID=2908642 RepID=A0AA46TKG4_9ACTN|nr:sugar-binding protein [Solicola gregarius]UYM06755.1 PIG-L family deacetylase [Solicola gregarius]
MRLRGKATAVVGALLVAGTLAAPPATADSQRHVAPPDNPGDLDVLFVGAHPDDESGRLSMFGEWRERFGVKTGVVTVTRGEGGGNAVGPEEGPALGLIREAEERRAVGHSGVTDVYNLDKVDFYYSVSEPLHRETWGHNDSLGKVVRVIRETTPDIIMTMDTAPSPGNHGGHQEASLLAAEAYYAAGDPSRFPGQIRKEGLEPYAPKKLFSSGARGTGSSPGANCATTLQPDNPADDIYGVWSGRRSATQDKTYAQIERESQREYASQGWAGFPDVDPDPAKLGCDFMYQVDSRVPFVRGDLTAEAASSATMLEGAVLQEHGGLPLGTQLDMSTEQFEVTPGGSSDVRISLTAPAKTALKNAAANVRLPDGWKAKKKVTFGDLKKGQTKQRTVTVTAAADAATNERALVSANVSVKGGQRGYTNQQFEVAPAVTGTQDLLPRVETFHEWADTTGVPQLKGTVKPVQTLPSGGSRTIGVDLHNSSDGAQSGEVSIDLPDGFEADAASKSYSDLAAGESTTVEFEVTNTDDSLPTSNEGGEAGDYAYSIETTSDAGTSTTEPALELVPATTIEESSAAPEVDGEIGSDEYTAEIDLSRVWEGDACESADDCSATGYVTRNGDDLYYAVDVMDDELGTVLAQSDCKRHWRTDSLEVAIDPDGRSENTSSTFKQLVLPTTEEGGPCTARDADNQQGPIDNPDIEVASKLKEPFTGYVIEGKIPASALPSTVDPEHLGLNMFIYDSDTQDKTGQTRIGWSTWGGVQGDPYRWGIANLPDWTPPEVETQDPVIPLDALESLDSPQSIAQAARTGVALSGGPQARKATSATLVNAKRSGKAVVARVKVRGAGKAHLFAVDADGQAVASVRKALKPGVRTVRIPKAKGAVRVVLGYDAKAGGTTSTAVKVR